MKKNEFNEFRFEGLNYKDYSKKYWTMKRVSDNNEKIVVKVGDSHLKKTLYGYALILDETHVVFLKEWQVSENYYGNEVLITKNFFNVKEWGQHNAFLGSNEENYNFDNWLKIALEQEKAGNCVKWEKVNKAQRNRYLYGV